VPGSYHIWILLMYCCGLRPAEARRLSVDDVDIEQGLLRIRSTKFRKDRYVPMSPATTLAVRDYSNRRATAAWSARADAHFIVFAPDASESHCNGRRFQEICASAGVCPHPGCRRLRPHDARHTFAVHRLLEWYRQGVDVQGKLHLLSTYMGHAEIVYTEKYLHATPELLGEASDRFRNRCAEALGVRDE